MPTFENHIVDISELESITLNLCKTLKVGNILFLRGELGVGKTTFSRLLIKNLYLLANLPQPKSINSPTYPKLLTYSLGAYDVYHYDFYRIKNIEELEYLDFFENIKSSITLIEWPEILINLPFKEKYYLIDLDLVSESKRSITIKYID
ncbi:tRNA (adenosine(37)-N6)-threonylcarbamoyltransferase complex ATPase subunit type 1 TsaE [Pelagibacteraceae bacterium]|nr:tRNA (adenosine(37)-N6)-threonylcarbamoyltransferase complex ATPase subunit type 1 TsaE [Pelagibacteraceae bacterium]